MKKRLEAELISIAHRILKLKNKSEVDQLYKETQKLYETLSVLKFYQDNFESVKSDLKLDALEEKLEQTNTLEEVATPVTKIQNDPEEVAAEAEIEAAQQETEAEIEEAVAEEAMVSEEPEASLEEETPLEEPTILEEEETVVNSKPSFEPIFQLDEEEEEEDEIAVAETASEVQPKEKLEDMIGNYADPVFVKPNEVTLFPLESKTEDKEDTKEEAPKVATPNEALSKSIAIGLNDRIGFVQHLFNDSNEDFNRVISQLNTFDTFEEAKTFINEMVIPDYNYWVGEEDYIERFMAIVEKKFQ